MRRTSRGSLVISKGLGSVFPGLGLPCRGGRNLQMTMSIASSIALARSLAKTGGRARKGLGWRIGQRMNGEMKRSMRPSMSRSTASSWMVAGTQVTWMRSSRLRRAMYVLFCSSLLRKMMQNESHRQYIDDATHYVHRVL